MQGSRTVESLPITIPSQGFGTADLANSGATAPCKIMTYVSFSDTDTLLMQDLIGGTAETSLFCLGTSKPFLPRA